MVKTQRFPEAARRLVLHILLMAIAVFMLLPFLWMVSTSLKTPGQVFAFPPKWIPNPPQWSNYVKTWTIYPMGSAYFNSSKISLLVTFGSLFSSSLAAYAFAKIRFRLRDPLFFLLLATLMIPMQVTLIPLFILFREIGWIDTHLPLIVPNALTNPYGVFLLRQFMAGIPDDLVDAARIDGCNPWRIYLNVMLPNCKPALSALGILIFINTWNSFLTPLIYLNSVKKYTISLVLASFQGAYSTDWSLLMAAACSATLPMLIVYIFGQRYFVEGITMSGLKG